MENNFKGTKWTIKQPKGISWITIMSDKTEIAEISSSLSDDAQDYISKLVTDAQAVQTQIDCSLSEFLERFKAMEKFLNDVKHLETLIRYPEPPVTKPEHYDEARAVNSLLSELDQLLTQKTTDNETSFNKSKTSKRPKTSKERARRRKRNY